MDANLAHILQESNSIITRLQLMATFFEDDDIYKIYLRSQVIHKLFENNSALDINKLELFHLQFTATTIELLKKIKKGNEQNVSVMFDEIELNKEVIQRLSGALKAGNQFNQDKKNQALKISLSLRRLFESLSAGSNEDPFSRNISSLSSRYAQDFFDDITPDLFEQITRYEPAEVYVHPFAVVQKKLMGNLCKYDFKVEFHSAYKCGTPSLEVYKLLESDKYFLFLQPRNLLLFCDEQRLAETNLQSSMSKKEKLVQDLLDKNTILETQVKQAKTYIPAEIKSLLVDTYNKISNISFLQNLSNVDAQANILKTMLNTDSL